jgi:hypothetical protein
VEAVTCLVATFNKGIMLDAPIGHDLGHRELLDMIERNYSEPPVDAVGEGLPHPLPWRANGGIVPGGVSGPLSWTLASTHRPSAFTATTISRNEPLTSRPMAVVRCFWTASTMAVSP